MIKQDHCYVIIMTFVVNFNARSKHMHQIITAVIVMCLLYITIKYA